MPRPYHELAQKLTPVTGTRAERMQTVADALWNLLHATGVSWVGFYLPEGDSQLVLGPSRDKPACSPIGLHGACGRARGDPVGDDADLRTVLEIAFHARQGIDVVADLAAKPLHELRVRLGAVGGGQPALVVNWAAAVLDPEQFRSWIAEEAEVSVSDWHEAGGTCTLDDDRRAVEAAASVGSTTASSLLILVKAWEPPMKDFLDFLRELRAALLADRLIHVLPLGRSAAGEVTAAEPHQRELWQKVLARQGDPWLSCSRLGGEEV